MADELWSETWTGERVERWLRQAEGLDRQMAPVSDALFAAAALRPGERVLDAGCGSGSTTRRAALEVGAAGAVVGLDVSGDMVAAAAAVPVAEGAAPIEWIEADVVSWTPPAGVYDVVLSRFGVMFFSDPEAAFARLAVATRPGGRLCAAVWAPREESQLFSVPYRAALDALSQRGVGVEEPPADAGPFSLSDDDRTVALLAAAGWTDVRVTGETLQLTFLGGMVGLEAARAALDFGPTRVVAADLGDGDRDAVVAAIASAIADHVDASGHVVLEARVHLLLARRP